MKSRVYVLIRGGTMNLPPQVFSSLARAKKHAATYYPFSEDWVRNGTRHEWVGTDHGGVIYSCAVDELA